MLDLKIELGECYWSGYRYKEALDCVENVTNTYIEKYGYRADAAGIVGNAENCTINNCYNQGMITALSSTGGIVADAENTNILNSINKGRIIGKFL